MKKKKFWHRVMSQFFFFLYRHSANSSRVFDDVRKGGASKDPFCYVSGSAVILDGRSAMLFFEHTLSM